MRPDREPKKRIVSDFAAQLARAGAPLPTFGQVSAGTDASRQLIGYHFDDPSEMMVTLFVRIGLIANRDRTAIHWRRRSLGRWHRQDPLFGNDRRVGANRPDRADPAARDGVALDRRLRGGGGDAPPPQGRLRGPFLLPCQSPVVPVQPAPHPAGVGYAFPAGRRAPRPPTRRHHPLSTRA
ncbi:hypothetical protein [Pararhodobacter sp. SW119]|uniref:hypothetical protein n=1 Tax=Pararhodobacter sp. SW119 TaxID=2780075 RepID=UPI001FD7B279|nr:hypothetical protein [Pararhodobacter sp. SW119]